MGVERFLDRFVVRGVLSAAIIVSLIPLPWVEGFDVLFLGIFGTEFLLRLWAIVVLPPPAPPTEGLGMHRDPGRRAQGRRPRAGAIALMLFDLVALLSFLPIPVNASGARWLRLFRLTRMLLLVGYWAPLVRDLWAILARRERARQLILMGFVVSGLSFAGAVVLYHLGDNRVDITDDGAIDGADANFLNLLWWSFRQVQDPGNMLSSPMALPVVVISLMLTVFGLFLVSFLIGLGTDVVHELLELSRMRPPGLKGHTVVVNISPSTQRLLHELMRYYKKLLPTDARPLSAGWFADLRRRGVAGPRYVVVGQNPEPPEFLRQPELSRIVYRQRAEDEEELIVRSDLTQAKRIVLLADENDSAPDAETIRTLVTLVERVRDRDPSLGTLARQRVVIAEILDESNVPAAQAALATGQGEVRGFVVPTEKLLALFFASVSRRPGLGHLLEELLTSRGHEIYTCFFQGKGLGFSMEHSPSLPTTPSRALDELLHRGLRRSRSGGRVIPVGLFTDRPAGPGEPDFDVWINPQDASAAAHSGPYRGFIGVADNFRSIRALAEDLPKDAADEVLEAPRIAPGTRYPEFERTHRTKTTKVLVCGFRPGSVYMLEELFRSDPGGEVLVLVEDARAKRAAYDALEGHSQLVKQGLMHGRHGVFEREEGTDRILFRPHDRPDAQASALYLRVADWMSSRHLVNLPLDERKVSGFEDIAKLDAIIFVASHSADADKRISTALLKLERLFALRLAEGVEPPRVVAEVIDGRLATRLEQRCRELGVDNVRVFSIQELRAYFLFQSVVVPGFDSVYAELLGSWGQSFVHKSVLGAPSGPCSFQALALHLRRAGEVLVAVELRSTDARAPELCVAPSGSEPGTRFDLRDLVGVWVIAPDSGEVAVPRVSRVAGVADAR